MNAEIQNSRHGPFSLRRGTLALYRFLARILLPPSFRSEYGEEIEASVGARLASRERALGVLSKPERKKAMTAVVQVLQHEQEWFNAELRTNLPQYCKKLEARLKGELEAQKKVTADLRKKAKQPFDKKDFRFIRGVLHSDRAVDPSKRDKAFNLFLQLEGLFK